MYALLLHCVQLPLIPYLQDALPHSMQLKGDNQILWLEQRISTATAETARLGTNMLDGGR